MFVLKVTVLWLFIIITNASQISFKNFILEPENITLHFQDIKSVVQNVCVNSDSDDAFSEIFRHVMDANSCLQNYLNFTKIQAELDKSKKTGSMDVVFNKYCQEYPEMYNCFENVTSFISKCLDDEHNALFNKTLGVLEIIKEYLCFKDGDRIAHFIDGDGLRCVAEQTSNLQGCLNNTFNFSLENLHIQEQHIQTTSYFVKKDYCSNLSEIRACFYRSLSKCQKISSANLADAFFKFLRKKFSCKVEVPLPLYENSDFSIRMIVVFFLIVLTGFVCYMLNKKS